MDQDLWLEEKVFYAKTKELKHVKFRGKKHESERLFIVFTQSLDSILSIFQFLCIISHYKDVV